MKSTPPIIIAILAILYSNLSYGEPVRYQLEGHVRGIYGEGPSVENLGLQVGDYIKYVFVTDKTKPACIHYEDRIDFPEDVNNEFETNTSYYASLIDISYQLPDTYYNFTSTNYIATDISSPTYPNGPFTRITAGPPLLYVDSSSYLADWKEGDELGGAHWWHDSINGEFITMHTSLVLTLISIDNSEHNECGASPDTPDKSDNSTGGGAVNIFLILFIAVLLIVRKRD